MAYNCTSCPENKVLVQLDTHSYCQSAISVEKSYFIVSLSKLYIKFNETLNKDIKLSEFGGVLIESESDYKAYLANNLPSTRQIPFTLKSEGYKVYNSHLIFKIDIAATNIDKGVFILKFSKKRHLNNSQALSFYPDDHIVVTNINYYRASASFENIIGIIFGVVLGLTGILALFIPAIKYTVMSMKIFQMNNYFFTMNVNLPQNLFLFFENIQYGNLIRWAVNFNPLIFLANDTCKEFQEKLLAIDRTCQLFNNAGPHILWFGISAIVKGGLEGWQWYKEKQGQPRGKLYEFLKLKFGKRYFIELLNYFHMDLVLYNLMNLLFSEIDNFTTFLNLFVSVLLMVFFIYFYIQLFVIVSVHSQDYLLSNLCDPLNKLGSIAAKRSEIAAASGESMQDLPGNGPPPRKSVRKSTKNANRGIPILDKDGAPIPAGDKPTEIGQKPATKLGWDIKRLFEEIKFRKFKLPEDKNAEQKEQFKAKASVAKMGIYKGLKKEEKEDATFEPFNIYRFLFINSHCLNVYSTNYYPISLIKEFILALVLVVAYSSGVVQSLVFLVVFTTIFFYNLAMEPLQNSFNNRLLKIYSGLYVLMSIITFALNIFDESVSPALLYNFFGYILILVEIGIICTLVTMTVSQFLKTRRDKKILTQGAVHPESKSEMKPLKIDEKVNGDVEKDTEKHMSRPVSNHSKNSVDSFKKLGIKLPKKMEDGGIFFQPKNFGNQGNRRDDSNSSFVSKNSWKMSKSRVGIDPVRDRPIPKRVDSMTEEISIDGLNIREKGMEEHSVTPSKTNSKSSAGISKAKSKGAKRVGGSKKSGNSKGTGNSKQS